MGGSSFEDDVKKLDEEFLGGTEAGETNEDVGRALLDHILARERMRLRVPDDDPRRAAVDRASLQRLASIDSLGPEHSIAQVALARLVKSPVASMDYLEELITRRRKRQSDVAKHERPKDIFTQTLDEFVSANPKVREREVIKQFKKHDDFEVLGEEVRHLESHNSLPLDRLRNRLTDAKKRKRKKDSGQPG